MIRRKNELLNRVRRIREKNKNTLLGKNNTLIETISFIFLFSL